MTFEILKDWKDRRRRSRSSSTTEEETQHHDTILVGAADTDIFNSDRTTSSPKDVRNSIIAGWTAGVTGTLAGHPLDSLKVWVQTGIRPTSAKQATTTTGQATGVGIVSIIRRFYAGVGAPLVTVGLIQSINFAVYDTTRRFYYFHMDNPEADPFGPNKRAYLDHDSYASIGIAGFTAGAVLSVITSPILVIKTLQQTNHQMGFKDALALMRRNPSTGFGVHFATETLNRSVYFCTYEFLKRYFEQPEHDNGPVKMSLSARMTASFVAGINCWAWLYPVDALRSRIFANMTADVPLSGMEMAKVMYANGDWRSFYRGFAVTTLRAGPVAAAILPVFDYTLDALNKVSS